MSNPNGQGKRGCLFYIFIFVLIDIGISILFFIFGALSRIDGRTWQTIGLIAGGIVVLIASIFILVKVHQYKKRKEQERLRAEQERELKNAEEVRKRLTAPSIQTKNNQKDIGKCQVSAVYFSCDLQTRYMEAMEDAWMTHSELLEAVKKTNGGN